MIKIGTLGHLFHSPWYHEMGFFFYVCCDSLGHVDFLSVREIQDMAMTSYCSIQLGSVIKTALK